MGKSLDYYIYGHGCGPNIIAINRLFLHECSILKSISKKVASLAQIDEKQTGAHGY